MLTKKTSLFLNGIRSKISLHSLFNISSNIQEMYDFLNVARVEDVKLILLDKTYNEKLFLRRTTSGRGEQVVLLVIQRIFTKLLADVAFEEKQLFPY
ncbi:hypothetical protein CR203_23935 [Salipaludibacillus neizhouensis]|uniref:Uncharacterized protein n=1 Tax=Salipaludibacillus neizhouensis TaxID=885475 RepID=A0A3A9KJ11_9BACI|nr:hypothetical protein [Salipaludibacillus neizhouensis]RKL64876.1 hypothetical protein CR203_23935 [Salipaludibacillus neizhouensis]